MDLNGFKSLRSRKKAQVHAPKVATWTPGMQMYMLLLQVLSLDLTDACLLYLILVSRCLCLRQLVPSVKVGTEVCIPYLVPNRTLGIEIFSRHQKKNFAEDTRNRVDGSFQFTKKLFLQTLKAKSSSVPVYKGGWIPYHHPLKHSSLNV